MNKKFNTSYGTAGGSSYGYKSKAERSRAIARSKALSKMAKALPKDSRHREGSRDKYWE